MRTGKYDARRFSLFLRTSILFAILICVLLGTFAVTNAVNEARARDELERNLLGQLRFLVAQIESSFNDIAVTTISMVKDPGFQRFQVPYFESSILNANPTIVARTILDRLAFEGISDDWEAIYLVYSPSVDQVITPANLSSEARELFLSREAYRWYHESDFEMAGRRGWFVWISADPFGMRRTPWNANLNVAGAVADATIERVLSSYGSPDQSRAFLLHVDDGELVARGDSPLLDRRVADAVVEHADGHTDLEMIVDLDSVQYVVHAAYSTVLRRHVVSFTPTREYLAPIRQSRLTFYATVLILLVLAVGYSLQLYRQVQLPLNRLVEGSQALKAGAFSTRIADAPRGEFSYIISSFNEMASELQHLVETVYREEIRLKEAKLELLQSQMDPHFLYNCLAFIMNMTKLGERDLVLDMTHKMGKYYRYITQLDRHHVTVRDELEFGSTYLELHRLRSRNLELAEEVPEQIHGNRVPFLIVQPLLENALVHGLGDDRPDGRFIVIGSELDDGFELVVSDNGVGMNDEERDRLNAEIASESRPPDRFALWNIHHRIVFMYGDDSGLSVREGTLGGCDIVLTFRGSERSARVER